MVQAATLQRVVQLARAVRRDDRDRRLRGRDPPDLRDGDGEVGEHLEEEGLELVVGAVELVHEQERAAALAHRPEQRPLDEEVGPVEVGDVGRLGRARGEQLTGVVPLVQRLRGVDPLVALQPDQLSPEQPREGERDLRLADSRLALQEQRSPQLQREVDRRREAPVGQVRRAPKGVLDLPDGREAHAAIVGERRLEARIATGICSPQQQEVAPDGTPSELARYRSRPCAVERRPSAAPRDGKEVHVSRIALTVNGVRHEADVEPRRLLVDFIREDLGLTGTNVGCDTSQCGSCTIHLDGKAVKSCTVLAAQADGATITTIEGLADNGTLHPIQEAFRDVHALQCGFCTPGMIMTAAELVGSGEELSDEAIRKGLEGNLCRCTGYENIVRAVRAAAGTGVAARSGVIEQQEQATGLIGQPVKRVEDARLVSGAANFLDDVKVTGMTHAAIFRSPYAHARIRSIDTSAAASAPGVLGVYTGKDFEDLPVPPCAWQAGGVENFVNAPRLLEIDRVTHLGAAVAVVVAETREQAEDALALVDVDWEPLDAIVDVEQAVSEGALQIHENAPGNIVMDWSCGDEEDTDRALHDAEVVIRQRLENQRLIPNSMETRGAAAQYDAVTGQYTVWLSSQTPHIMRLLMTAFVFGIPETKMRVIAPQVGGGFGSKIYLYHEYPLVAALARKVGRPVKWIESRRENYVARPTAAPTSPISRSAPSGTGRSPRSRRGRSANLGGILSTIAPGIPTTLYGRMLSGAYRFPNIYCNVTGVYTNTGMVDAYRGAGRPEATYLIERAMDLVAASSTSTRSRCAANFIPSDAFPYERRQRSSTGSSTTRATTRRRSAARSRPWTTRASARSRRRRGRKVATSASASRAMSRSAASPRPSGSARSARAGARACGRAPTSAST